MRLVLFLFLFNSFSGAEFEFHAALGFFYLCLACAFPLLPDEL
jgi:hypothetical protein